MASLVGTSSPYLNEYGAKIRLLGVRLAIFLAHCDIWNFYVNAVKFCCVKQTALIVFSGEEGKRIEL
jgi:hypothetical protein